LLELSIRQSDSPLGLNGSGILIVNPPWRLDDELSAILPAVANALATGAGGTPGHRLDWIAPER